MYNDKNMLDLLCAMLGYDRLNFKTSENGERDWEGVLKWISARKKLDFNIFVMAIVKTMETVVDIALDDMQDEIIEHIADLEKKAETRYLNNAEKEKLNALEKLEPLQDIRYGFNRSGATIKFADNGSIYRKYLSDLIDNFERDIGLKIADAEAENERRRNLTMYDYDNENMLVLLCAILDCDRSDFKTLENGDHDWEGVLKWISAKKKLDFKVLIMTIIKIMETVIAIALNDMRIEIIERMTNLYEKAGSQCLNDAEQEKLNALEDLEPFRDIRYNLNRSGVTIRFARNGSVYRKHLSDAIDEFEYDVGLKIIDDEEAPKTE